MLRKELLQPILKTIIGASPKTIPGTLNKGDVVLYNGYLYEYKGENGKEVQLIDSSSFKQLGLRFRNNLDPYSETVCPSFQKLYSWFYEYGFTSDKQGLEAEQKVVRQNAIVEYKNSGNYTLWSKIGEVSNYEYIYNDLYYQIFQTPRIYFKIDFPLEYELWVNSKGYDPKILKGNSGVQISFEDLTKIKFDEDEVYKLLKQDFDIIKTYDTNTPLKLYNWANRWFGNPYEVSWNLCDFELSKNHNRFIKVFVESENYSFGIQQFRYHLPSFNFNKDFIKGKTQILKNNDVRSLKFEEQATTWTETFREYDTNKNEWVNVDKTQRIVDRTDLNIPFESRVFKDIPFNLNFPTFNLWIPKFADIYTDDKGGGAARNMNQQKENDYGLYFKLKHDGVYEIKFNMLLTSRDQHDEYGANGFDGDRYALYLNDLAVRGTKTYCKWQYGQKEYPCRLEVEVENGKITKAKAVHDDSHISDFTASVYIVNQYGIETRDNELFLRVFYAIWSFDDPGEWNEWQFAHVYTPFIINYLGEKGE